MSGCWRSDTPTAFTANSLPSILRLGFGDGFPLHVRDGIKSAANQSAPMAGKMTLAAVRMTGHLPKLVLDG